MRRAVWKDITLTVALLLVGSLAGCVSQPVNESASVEQQDSAVAVAIKSRLLEAPDLAGSAIDVTLEGDRAILTGFVETEEQKERAEAIAEEHDQVKAVVNNLTVK